MASTRCWIGVVCWRTYCLLAQPVVARAATINKALAPTKLMDVFISPSVRLIGMLWANRVSVCTLLKCNGLRWALQLEWVEKYRCTKSLLRNVPERPFAD